MVSMSVRPKIDMMMAFGLLMVVIGAWDLNASMSLVITDPGMTGSNVTDLMRFKDIAGCIVILAAGIVTAATYRLDISRRIPLVSVFLGIGLLLHFSALPEYYIVEAVLAFAIIGSALSILTVAFSVMILAKRDSDISVLMAMSMFLFVLDVLAVITSLAVGAQWPCTIMLAHGAIPLTLPLVFMIYALWKSGVRAMPRTESGKADLMTVLAISMMVAGLTYILYVLFLTDDLFDMTYTNALALASGITMAAGGMFVLFSGRYRFWTRASFAGLFFGIATLFTCSDLTSDYSEIAEFLTTVIALVAGVSSIVASVSMIFGYKHYATRLFQAFCLMIAVQAVPIYQCYYYGIHISLSISFVYPQIVYIAAYAVMLVVLHDQSVRVVPVTERVDSSFGIIKNTMYSDEDDYILPEDVESLERFIESGSGDTLRIPIRGEGDSEIVLSRSSEGAVFGTMLPTVGKTFLDGFRFEVCTLVHVADGVVRIYGREGAFVQILVHPVPPERTMKDRLLIFPRKDTESDE